MWFVTSASGKKIKYLSFNLRLLRNRENCPLYFSAHSPNQNILCANNGFNRPPREQRLNVCFVYIVVGVQKF